MASCVGIGVRCLSPRCHNKRHALRIIRIVPTASTVCKLVCFLHKAIIPMLGSLSISRGPGFAPVTAAESSKYFGCGHA